MTWWRDRSTKNDGSADGIRERLAVGETSRGNISVAAATTTSWWSSLEQTCDLTRVGHLREGLFFESDRKRLDRPRATRLISATTADESLPPDRNAPIGTSEIMRSVTASNRGAAALRQGPPSIAVAARIAGSRSDPRPACRPRPPRWCRGPACARPHCREIRRHLAECHGRRPLRVGRLGDRCHRRRAAPLIPTRTTGRGGHVEEQRFFSEPIAPQNSRLRARVPDCEREHGPQPVDETAAKSVELETMTSVSVCVLKLDARSASSARSC